jgi:uncharacterized protein
LSSINKVQTPCIGICSTGIGDVVCRGCKRFTHEVIDWNRYAPEQRQAVMARLQDLLNQIVSSKIEVTDSKQLLMHLDYQQVDHDKTQSPQVLVYALLRVGANQVKDTHHFGFSIRPKWQHYSLPSLKQQIDEDFYILSCAYYERFIEPTRLITIK